MLIFHDAVQFPTYDFVVAGFLISEDFASQLSARYVLRPGRHQAAGHEA